MFNYNNGYQFLYIIVMIVEIYLFIMIEFMFVEYFFKVIVVIIVGLLSMIFVFSVMFVKYLIKRSGSFRDEND